MFISLKIIVRERERIRLLNQKSMVGNGCKISYRSVSLVQYYNITIFSTLYIEFGQRELASILLGWPLAHFPHRPVSHYRSGWLRGRWRSWQQQGRR